MISFRKAIRFCSLVLTLGVPFAASAATFDVKTLIDTDNNRGTGCNVVTPSGIVSGIDVMITTAGTVTGSTGTVTAVTRQTCVNPVLNQFSSPVAVDGGWNVGVSTAGATAGDVFVESHMGLDVLTMDNIGTPRFVFTSSSGLAFDVLLTPWSWGGGDIVMPHAARDRAMTPLAQRNIVLDGLNPDWAGNVPLANGTASPPVWRFISAGAYAGLHDLFFNFHIHTNGSAPTAHDDNYSLSTLGGTLTVATLGVLNNDNPNNQPITASLVDSTQHGTLALAPNGGFTYIHDGSLASQDQFHYVAVGTSLVSNVATVTIDLPGTHPYTFTSANAVTFTAGQFNTFQVTVTGKPTPALSEDGALPSGVTFVDNGNGTGTLSGTPAANSVAVYPIVFNAEKNKPHGSSQNFTLTVTCPGVTSTITPTPPQVCANSAGNTAAGPAGMTTYTWSITNGTITSAANIQTITYTAGASGAVGLTLTVADASGCSATANRNVTINPTPTATISPAPPQVCANSTGNTAAGPAGMAIYAWSIVNGTITSATNVQTITYTAGASGTVGLNLTVTTAAGCSASNSANVTINANPTTPAITPTPSSVCANSSGNSAAGPAGATSYAWSITNGTITSATNTQAITYTAGASGTVGLTLVVTNAAGCSASNTANVTINPAPATPTITPTPAQVCANSAGNSAAGPAGATTYAWSITNGTITSATNIQTITYTAGASGVVGLTLTVTNASACSATNTANVTINANPSAPAITPSPAQVCASSTGNTASGPAGAATYAWSIVNGTITSATNIQTITYTAGASGTVGLTLTVTNASGCSATNSGNVTINANPSAPTITPTPSSVCASSAGNTAAGPAGAASYAWSITNGTITSAANLQTVTYTAGASGTVGLTLTVTNASGCSATNNANVTINANPATPTITPTPAQVCGNSTGNAASGPAGATSYAWSITNGAITSATNVQNITYTAGASGVVGLTLTVTNPSGCSATNTANVTINPSPATPTITPTPAQVCANSTGNTAAGPAGAATYAWSIVNGTITSATNIQTITYTAGASGTVDLTLVVTNGSGCPATNTVNVTINANPTTPAISPSPSSVCANSTGNTAAGPAGATSYAWSIVNGTITSATNIQTITYTAGVSGTVDLTLVVTNAAGCSASNTTNVTINPNPATPTITATPTSVCANSTGNTADGPAGATSYAWSIVNGTITSATNIQTITFTAGASGTVDLTLVVTNLSGCSASNTANVTINPSPATPTITTPAQVCANSTGNSASGPAGATSYAWSIVNGTITSATNIQTITYTAGASGTVDLTLVVTNGSGCSATNTVNVIINANPATPTITPTPAQVCANSTGNTAAGPAGATSYAWSITNGTITSATNIQTITYTAGASGTVGLTLVVTNASGCSASATNNVTINANPATPTISPSPAQVCANSTGNTAAGPAGATSYAWSIVNGTITSATNIQTITYTAGASGTVDLTLVVTNASGCSASATSNVTINANPATPTISPSPAQVCANSTGNTAAGPAGATSYAWSIVNGTITSATNIQTITYTAGASGTVDLTLVVTNPSGCSASNTNNVIINANPATPTITTPANACANSTGNSASGPAGATSYAWSITNGTITSATNIQTITYTAGASGTVGLTLVVTNPSGCSASNTSNVTINANPATPTITPSPAQVCANSTGNTASGPAGATSYAWSIVNGTITSATNVQTITYTAGPSGTVDLTLVVSNGAGCSASATNNVIINANPATPSITTPASTCANSTGNSASGPAGATSYAWSITNGTITSATNIQSITYTAGASGTVGLTLLVTNASGCSATGTSNVTINANPATPSITTPASTCANSTGNSASGPAGATSYAWSITNGTITSATNIQTITYTAGASGTVGLTLVVTNASGCSATGTANVTINANPATPAITTPASTCANSTGNSASGPAGATSYAWSITNGTITSATNIQTITYTAGASGTVGLTLVVTNASGCSATGTSNVTINANPAAPVITPTPATLCPSSTGNTASGPAGATSYSWSIVNGTITSATNIQTITYTAGASGTTDLTLVVTNAAGCSATSTANVPNSNVAPSVTTHPLTQSVLVGTSVTFTAAASGTPTPTVQWQVSTGGPFSDISGETNTSLTFTTQLSQSGNQYRAVFTNACGTATTNAATLTVTCPTITVTRNPSNPFPNGVYNTAYNQSFTATGGTGPYTFAQTGGTFPTGLNLASNGAITGTPTATGVFNFNVTATDTATGCTSASTAFAISIAPSAVNDNYAANNIIDNVQFVITGGTTTSPATPFVGATGNILTNDSSDAPKTATAGTFATTGGGSVTIAADGTFIYTPGVHAGAITSDTFTYTVVSSGVTSTSATVTLTLANRVWFVKNNGAAGNGQSQSPFNTLAAAQTASAAGDIIYVYNGDGLTTGQTAGITLKNNQQLIGEGVALVVNTVTLKAAGTKPLITNTAGDGVTLANGNTLKGFTVTGTSSNGINGTNTNGLTVDTVTATAAGAGASSLVLTTPSNNVTITNTTLSNSPLCLTINGGTANFAMNNTNTITANAGQRSINFANLGATSVTAIGAAITDNGVGMAVTNSVNGAAISFTGTQTLGTTTNAAVTLGTNGATSVITFSGTLAITTSTGTGFSATGGGTLNVTGTANITTGAAANGLNLSGMTLTASGVTFNSVNTTGATTGVALTTLTGGTVTINGGTISGGTTGISLQGPATNLSLAGVTITGSTTAIANTTNFGTLTIGASVSVSGVTALNLTTGALNGTFASLSSTGGTNGVVLTSIGGTGWTATTGSLFGSTGAAFKVDGGSANMTYGGAIRSTGFLVDIGATTGRSGGTITFSTGTIGGTGAQSGTGIRIQNSTGTSTFTFSGSQTLGNSGNRIASTAVTLAGNNSTTVFNFSGTLAINSTGVTAFTATGPTGGTINFSGTDSIDAATGSALVLNGVALGAGTLSSVTSTGGVNGISLTTVTGGTLTISGGSLSGNTGAAFLVSAGSPTVSYAGTITQNTAGQRAVDIQNMTGGSVTLSGAIGSNGGSGVFLNADNGATINVSGAMTLSTGTANAFTATGGATMTVNVTSASNSITTSSGAGITWSGGVVGSSTETFNTITATTSGVAMSVASSGATNFTVGTVSSQTGTAVSIATATGDFIFTKISSNGAAKGITVTALTGGGSFTVNGTGGLCDSTHVSGTDCTGGSILGGTTRGGEFTNVAALTLNNMYFKGNGTTAVACGDDVTGGTNTTCNAGLYMVTVTAPSLTKIYVDGTGGSNNSGVVGNAVSAMTVSTLEIANFTNAAKTPFNFQNLTGTTGITGLNVHNNSGLHTVMITNNTGTANVTLTSPTINSNSGTGNPDSLQVNSYTAGTTLNVTATNVNITASSANTGNGVMFQANTGSTMTSILNGGVVTGTNGLLMQETGTNTTFTFTVTGLTNVTTHNLGSNAITVGKANGTNATFNGTVTNNTITSALCGGGCAGIKVGSFGVSGASTVNVSNNDISGVDAQGIWIVGGQGGSSLTMTVHGNNVHNPALTAGVNTSYGIDIYPGTQSGDAVCFAGDIGDMTAAHTVPANRNTITGAWQSGGNPLEVLIFNSSTFKLLNYPNSNTNDANAAAWVKASQTGFNVDAAHLGTNQFTAGASCP